MIATRLSRGTGQLVALIAVQGFCAAFFLVDAVRDLTEAEVGSLFDPHRTVEIIAACSLIVGMWFALRLLLQSLRRQAHLERNLSVAAGALHDVIERYFDDWGLTPAERDVAAFTLKGLSIAEVAALRGSAEGTVKAHLNAIYRKSGVSGRAQLVSLLIEDLMAGPLVPAAVETGSGRAAE